MKLHNVYVKVCSGLYVASYHYHDFSLVATGTTESEALKRLLSRVQKVTSELSLSQDDILDRMYKKDKDVRFR